MKFSTNLKTISKSHNSYLVYFVYFAVVIASIGRPATILARLSHQPHSATLAPTWMRVQTEGAGAADAVQTLSEGTGSAEAVQALSRGMGAAAAVPA